MMLEVPVAQLTATVVLNMALATAIGAAMTALWMASRDSGWAASRHRRLRVASATALAAALFASSALLWLAAAEMADVPLTEAGAAVWSMLSATHFGMAWTAGALALVLGAVVMAVRPGGKPRRHWHLLNLFALAAFAYTRSLASHASSNGDFTIRVLVDWLHLVLISVWVGEVVVAALLTLATPPGAQADDRVDCASYVAALSTKATYALGGIVATGLLNAWFNIGSPAAVIGSQYGALLLLKLALVAVAVLMGAYNRFVVMPPLIADVTAPALRRFTLVLGVEAVVLLGVIVVAAILSSTPPPTGA